MTDPLNIYFVTWPDGRVFEGTQTSVSEDIAIGRALLTWLPPSHFPDLVLGGRYHGPMAPLWKAMQKAGFRVQALEVPKEVADGISA